MKNIICTSNGIIGTKFTKEFINKNIKGKKVLIIDNGTYETRNFNEREKNRTKFIEYGAIKADLITINSENVNNILNYDICYMMGGSIANLVKMIQETNIKNILKEFLNYGMYIGESCGSIILDENVEWYFDLKRGTKPKYDVFFENYEGLGFIDEHIYPHYDKENEEGIKKINLYKEKIKVLNDTEFLEFSDNKITVEMACSINGMIATTQGEEEFLSDRGWEIMLEFLKNYDVLVWGRKTFESVMTWGDEYTKDLQNINMIILSSDSNKKPKQKNIFYAESVEDCLKIAKEKNFKKIFISGGAKTNTDFLKQGIVDEVIINYNPVIVTDGINLFTEEDLIKKLKLKNIIREKEDLVQIRYDVKKED